MPAGLHEAFRALAEELRDTSLSTTQDILSCDQLSADQLLKAAHILAEEDPLSNLNRDATHASIEGVLQRAHSKMASSKPTEVYRWRRLYTDASIILAFLEIIEWSCCKDERRAFAAISRLDHAIVIAGAPGEGRLDSVLELIEKVQKDCSRFSLAYRLRAARCLPGDTACAPNLPTSAKAVPRLTTPPSMASFISRFSQHPFVIPSFLSDWPALNDHPWSSWEYLRAVAGPGRVVPVEVGSDYRSDDWTQRMMSWDEFLDTLEEEASETSTSKPVLYLAQHSLFSQFPKLKNDVFVPDYVYSELDPPRNYPQYVPPANEERLVLNAWFGPGGTVSPAHTDPFFNFYGQVVGRKTIWLAPPEVSPYMHPYPDHSSSSPIADDSSQPRNPAANNESPSMSNTSRVDVLLSSPENVASSRAEFPDFWSKVVPAAMSITLDPGDLLFFPPGWWHAMRSEETSFSVSMWF